MDSASFFRNEACPYFPCHAGVDERRFNCLFCYCPLYALGPDCGGAYAYTPAGVKDCSACTRLHDGDVGARIVRERFSALAELAWRGRDGNTSGNSSGDRSHGDPSGDPS